MRMYCPSLKENVEATITDGKQVASKGGSLRNILYGEYEGRKCLPKTVKAEVFAQHGFAAETISKDMTFNIDIEDASIENEDELEERGYSQDEIEHMREEITSNVDADRILDDIKSNHLDSVGGDTYYIEDDSVYLKNRDKMVDDVEATIDYDVDAGGWSAENSGKMNLTMEELLILILLNKDWNENDWGGSGEYEEITASFYHDEVDMRKMRGVLSSLVKKGIITMVSVNNKYTHDLGSIDWNMFDCKDEVVQEMGYEKFVQWANNLPNKIIGGMMNSKFDAETFEAYDDPISDRQEWKINSLGGTVDSSMNRSEASDYIKELQGRKSGTWKEAEFTPEELTKSSAIHGDFDTASINYSGHQNLMMRSETFKADEDEYEEEVIESCEECGTIDSLYDYSEGKICKSCFNEENTKERGFDAESSPSSFDISWEDAQGVSSPSLPPEGIHFAEEGDYHMNGEGCEYCAETRELNAEGFCSECAHHADYFNARSYEDAFRSESVSYASEGLTKNGKFALGLTALGVGIAMAMGSEKVASLLDKINRK